MDYKTVVRKNDLVKPKSKNERKMTMDINQTHDIFGHIKESIKRKFCNKNNITLTSNSKTCVGCLESKAKRKPVKKSTDTRATEPDKRIFVDTSGPFPKRLRGHRYLFKDVDEYSRKNWNHFMKNKHELPKVLDRFILMIKAQGKTINLVRYDNADNTISR